MLPDCPAPDDMLRIAIEPAAMRFTHTSSGREGCFAMKITWHCLVIRGIEKIPMPRKSFPSAVVSKLGTRRT